MISYGEQDTESMAARFAAVLVKGDLVWLTGGLGAGKTAFVRGLARGLGVQGRVTSPTFALVNEYEGRLPLFHFDLYRLSGWDELWELGWDEYQERGVCAVEWSERLEGTRGGYTVSLTAENEHIRHIRITGQEGRELHFPGCGGV